MSAPHRKCNGIVHYPVIRIEECSEPATVVCSGPGKRPLQWYACENPNHRMNEDGTPAETVTVEEFFQRILP